MAILSFKTNLNCLGCVSKITPILDSISQIKHWEVNLNTPDKILTIFGDATEAEIINNVLDSGFEIEKHEN